MIKTVKGMGKGMRNSNTKEKGKHITIYFDPESLKWFLKIQKDWHLEGKNSETIQTILKMWRLFQTSLNHSDELIKVITTILSLNENKEKKES